MIADRLGHSRVSMTRDVYLGRRAANTGNLAALDPYDPWWGDERGSRHGGRMRTIRSRIRPHWAPMQALVQPVHAQIVGPQGIEP